MHGICRRWPNLLALFFLVGLGGLTAKLIASTPKSTAKSAKAAPKVVSPPNRAVLLSGHLDVIYRGENAELQVDSRPIAWEKSYDAPIHVGHLHLSPGMHRVRIGDHKVELCVALNEMEHDGPSDWKIHRVHSMSAEKDRCAECHDAETEGGRMTVGKPVIPDSCTACHTASELDDTHQEVVRPLKACDTCHVMHSSPFPSLLKAPKAEVLKKYGVEK